MSEDRRSSAILEQGGGATSHASELQRRGIVYVINNLKAGGTERHLTRLIGGLVQRQSWDMSVFCLERSGPLVEEIEALGVEVIGSRTPWSMEPRRVMESLGGLRAHLRRTRPELVHCYLGAAGLMGTLGARTAGVPHVVTTRRGTELYAPTLGELLRFRGANIFADLGSSLIITVSEANRRQALREGTPKRKLLTIHNGIEIPREMPTTWAFTGHPVFGTVGSLLPMKGHRHLIHAMPQVLASLTEARCVIVGDGPERRNLEQLSRDLGVCDHLTFLGHQSDVQGILQTLDVFVLPSLAEGLPNAVLEAMSLGRAVIATDVGGVPEVVTPEVNGILVPAESSHALATAMIRLGGDQELRRVFGIQARECVAQRFSSATEIDRTEGVYLDVLDRGTRRPGTSA